MENVLAGGVVMESRKVFIRVKVQRPIETLEKIDGGIAPMTISKVQQDVIIADVTPAQFQRLAEADDVDVFEDFRFDFFRDRWWEPQLNAVQPAQPAPWSSKTQHDVLDHINASGAWTKSTGIGVTIAILDTGVDGQSGFTPSPLSVSPTYATAWEDRVGHGTMCAAIAAASVASGARYNGVAPGATLLSARSTLMASDVYNIYTYLLTKKLEGNFAGGLVVSNSFGHYNCAAPQFPEGHPYVDLVRQSVAEGVTFVFAAGNNHAEGLCQHQPDSDTPNTIWATNSIDEVICVGTVNWDETNRDPGEHANSSRGPGDWSVRQDKPDVVAPTYGEVRWKNGYQTMEWWGTSGAAPQVAGLAALLMGADPALTPAQIMRIIRDSARALPDGSRCVGSGIIDCEKALQSV